MIEDEVERGALLARIRPWSVGVNLAGLPVTAGFPAPRRLEVYENGLLVRALTVEEFIERGELMLITRVPLGVRIHWEYGAGEAIAFVSSFRRGRIIRALESAGYAVS
ncbi:hypothetical protein [Gryllotalpicola protaetiae]|uniref:hypothetical protein n=1 Tax=Gryllotalpicola protaetiae TaxID=2419771 RepID=UPI0013C4427A|nr:hypothetical protein [Gryllotalpicola protaetiae]